MHLDLLTFNVSLFAITQSEVILSSKLRLALSYKYVLCLNVVYNNVSSAKLKTLKLVLFSVFGNCYVLKTIKVPINDWHPPKLTN